MTWDEYLEERRRQKAINDAWRSYWGWPHVR